MDCTSRSHFSLPHRHSAQPTVVTCILVLFLAAQWPALTAGDTAAARSPFEEVYSGWALEAYPDMTLQQMETALRRMAAGGANVAWIGHNNPGEVDSAKVEPGLSYAVYAAFQDRTHPKHSDAVQIVDAQHRMLAACRLVGLKAVLPIGYQIQMGRDWNVDHPADLRLDSEGQLLDIFGGGVSATFYSPAYRRDITSYYHWIDVTFVRPYSDQLLMLNLADEPIGGDYSSHAETELIRRYGFGFAQVGNDTERQRLLGEFQAHYVVEYATYSAALWQQIHPGVTVTMSFDGAQGRLGYTLPDVEALFRDTPANFVISFDAYPHDGPPDLPATEADHTALVLLARSVGLYSSRFRKPVWLWAAANRWGLSGDSTDPGTESDAVANGLSLALLVRQVGGDLGGIVYWNYNVKGQGLYNDRGRTGYRVERLFDRVSATLPVLRRLMREPGGSPDVLVLAPSTFIHETIGGSRIAVRVYDLPFARLTMLARLNIKSAVIRSLQGWSLQGLRAIVVVAPEPRFLDSEDLQALRAYLSGGGRVVASSHVGATLATGLPAGKPEVIAGLVERRGSLYIARNGVAALFEEGQGDLRPFWHETLEVSEPPGGFLVATPHSILWYNPSPQPVGIAPILPFEAVGLLCSRSALPVRWIHAPFAVPDLGPREFIFLERVPPFDPRV